MDLALDLDKRSGRLLGPFIALYSVERLALPDFVPDGTTVALLTPSGETLALALSQGHAVTLDTNTTQAAAYAAGIPVGRSLNAFVVVGNTDNLLATVPVLVVANALDELAPPTQSAPHYPTSAELKAILNEVAELASAASKASEAVAQDTQRVEHLVNVALPKAVEEIDSHLDERVRAAEKTIERAAVDASYTLSESATAASAALDNKVSNASTALDNKVSAASTALDGKVSAANNAATSADGSAKAAAKSRQDAEAAKGNAAESAKNASTSATASATSASQALASAIEAQGAVVNTLKRQEWADGAIYSELYNQSAFGISWNNEKLKEYGLTKTSVNTLIAFDDRYLAVFSQGFLVLDANDLSILASAKWGLKNAPTSHSHAREIAFNKDFVVVFGRFAESISDRKAKIFDATTGELLVEKTFTDAEMETLNSAPLIGVPLCCICKNGDIIYRGVIFSSVDLSIKGFLQSALKTTQWLNLYAPGNGCVFLPHCCYVERLDDLTAYPIIIGTARRDGNYYSVWVDDRNTFDENGNLVITLRDIEVEGVALANAECAFFSFYKYSYTNKFSKALILQKSAYKLYDATFDPSKPNALVFSNAKAVTGIPNPYSIIPTNFYTSALINANVPFYILKGVLLHTLNTSGVVSNPVGVLPSVNLVTYTSNPNLAPMVAFASNPQRAVPTSRFFYDGNCLVKLLEIK